MNNRIDAVPNIELQKIKAQVSAISKREQEQKN
jgi:hypothetical protein